MQGSYDPDISDEYIITRTIANQIRRKVWKRLGLEVEKRNQDLDQLRNNNNSGEWVVAFHGIGNPSFGKNDVGIYCTMDIEIAKSHS